MTRKRLGVGLLLVTAVAVVVLFGPFLAFYVEAAFMVSLLLSPVILAALVVALVWRRHAARAVSPTR